MSDAGHAGRVTESTALAVWSFDHPTGAERVGRGLERTGPPWRDAGLLSWPETRSRPLTWQARELGDDQRLSGAFWGLLFASLFLLPLCLDGSDADDRFVRTPGLEQLGLPAGFTEAVRRDVVCGTSALFAYGLVSSAVIATSQLSARRLALVVFDEEQERRLHAGFGD